MTHAQVVPGTQILTTIPGRLDRLPFSGWHWRVVIALGITWVLDGLEVTLVGSLSPAIQNKEALGLSDSEIGLTGSQAEIDAVAQQAGLP